MKTQINKGKSIEITTPAGGYASGQVVKVGALVGISSNTYAQGDTAVIWLLGTHFVAKTATQAWTAGAILYWDDTAKSFTTTSASNTQAGYAWADAASADTTGYVLLSH
jgi:predicted RecA/RadA family phage recombinase